MGRRRLGWLLAATVLVVAIWIVNRSLTATAERAHADLVRIYELARRGDYASIRSFSSNYTASDLQWFERDHGKVERFQFSWSKAGIMPGYGAASGRVWRKGKLFTVRASIQLNRVYHVMELEGTHVP